MAFKGITFAGQNVTPKNDGGLYQAHYGDGILWGCSMNISGDDLVIQSGEFIMGGRVVQVDGATSVDLSGRLLSTGYIQVIMNADLSQGEGSQWYITFVESATTTFPALTQGNINNTDTLYQLELAVVQISGGNLTNIYTSMNPSPVVSPQVLRLLDENGDLRGKGDSYTNSADTKFVRTDPQNNSLSGIRCRDTDVTVFGNGGNLYLRPLGADDGSKQMYIRPDGTIWCEGQIQNALTWYSSSQLVTSVNAGATTKVLELASLPSGVYDVSVYLSINVTVSTAGLIQILWYRNGTNVALDQIYTNTNARKYRTTGWKFESGTTSVALYLTAPSGIALSGMQASMRAVRLG